MRPAMNEQRARFMHHLKKMYRHRPRYHDAFPTLTQLRGDLSAIEAIQGDLSDIFNTVSEVVTNVSKVGQTIGSGIQGIASVVKKAPSPQVVSTPAAGAGSGAGSGAGAGAGGSKAGFDFAPYILPAAGLGAILIIKMLKSKGKK